MLARNKCGTSVVSCIKSVHFVVLKFQREFRKYIADIYTRFIIRYYFVPTYSNYFNYICIILKNVPELVFYIYIYKRMCE